TRFSRDWSSDVCSSDLVYPRSQDNLSCVEDFNSCYRFDSLGRNCKALFIFEPLDGSYFRIALNWDLKSISKPCKIISPHFLRNRSEERRVGKESSGCGS